MIVYLSGGMHSDWQDIVKRNCPEFTFSDPREHELVDASEYTFWDMLAIQKCDIVFAYLERDNPSGLGLAFEIGYALGLGKTVIFVEDKDNHYSDILTWASQGAFNHLYAGIGYLKSLAKIAAPQ